VVGRVGQTQCTKAKRRAAKRNNREHAANKCCSAARARTYPRRGDCTRTPQLQWLGVASRSSKMLGGASQIVSKIRVKCNGT
jgi:hypothetical protein